jgi:hypothetical protein
VAAPSAEARPYYPGRHHYYRGHGHGDAVAAGVAGLALGAIIGAAASSPRYYGPPAYYPPPAYGFGYYRGPVYCRTHEWVWDPYIGRRVLVERSYRC